MRRKGDGCAEIVVLLAMIALFLAAGILVYAYGYGAGVEKMELEATRAGVARYEADRTTGKVQFKWGCVDDSE